MTQDPRRKTRDTRLGRRVQLGKRLSFQMGQVQSKIEIRKSKIPFGFVLIAILAIIPFSLGKYFEFNQPDPYDSAMYAYSAKYILEGARIGVDEIPSAQIGTLLVNVLGVRLGGFSETGPKLIQGLLQATALVLMFVAMKKLFGTLSACAGVIIASVYLSAPVIAKFGNVKEQHMIAFIILGISCFVLYQFGGKWWYAMLAGAFLSWAPLFKQTGMSAVGAVGLFIIAQPILKNRTFKQTGIDILLLFAGAGAAIAPLYIWILGWNVGLPLPYSFVWTTLAKMLPAKAASGGAAPASDYLSASRKAVSLAEQAPMVFRYYGVLILPITLAACSVILRLVKFVFKWLSKSPEPVRPYDRFVLLFGLWWLLDMAFVWISPRPYEQYYLPLNASAAMLGGYVIAVYHDKLCGAMLKGKWVAVGAAGLICMIVMSWHIFFGITRSPATGADYGQRQRGYQQKWQETSRRRRDNLIGYWENVGDYIRQRSQPTDKIYVWGWIPGIYVRAQRFSSSPVACTSEMHVNPPPALSTMVGELLSAFNRQPPKFIVDTYNKHFPYDRRPPLELWPRIANGFRLLDNPPKENERLMRVLLQTYDVQLDELDKNGFLRPDRQGAVERYEAAYAKELREKIEPDEALRFEAMKPLREFVMKNYKIVQLFGEHVLFESKTPTANKEPQ